MDFKILISQTRIYYIFYTVKSLWILKCLFPNQAINDKDVLQKNQKSNVNSFIFQRNVFWKV